MIYFIIYFREDLEKFLTKNFIHQKNIGGAITTLLIIFWNSSDRNYDKIVAIFVISTNSKDLFKQESLLHLILI